MLTGHGPTASQRRLIKRSRHSRHSEQASEQMKARARAIDELMARPD
jgi:hypothetical protein